MPRKPWARKGRPERVSGEYLRDLQDEMRSRWRDRQARRWNPQQRDEQVAGGHQEGGHDGEDATWGLDEGR